MEEIKAFKAIKIDVFALFPSDRIIKITGGVWGGGGFPCLPPCESWGLNSGHGLGVELLCGASLQGLKGFFILI